MGHDRLNESKGFEQRELPDLAVSSSITTLKTTKAPGLMSPELSSERVFVTITLVEETCPPPKVTAIFSQVQRNRHLYYTTSEMAVLS